MTLTGQLKQADRDTAYTHLKPVVDPILQTPLDIAEVTVVVQDVSTEPFESLNALVLAKVTMRVFRKMLDQQHCFWL